MAAQFCVHFVCFMAVLSSAASQASSDYGRDEVSRLFSPIPRAAQHSTRLQIASRVEIASASGQRLESSIAHASLFSIAPEGRGAYVTTLSGF